MLLIKLGGSVISNKKNYRDYRESVVRGIAKNLPKEDLIVVHGAGSFGHILADEFKITDGFEEWKRLGFAKIERDMLDLNLRILDALVSEDIPAVSMPPHSFITMGKSINLDIFDFLLEHGFVPLTFGDAVFDVKKGINILSGDILMMELAKRYRPDKTIFLTDVDGIYTGPPDREDSSLIRELPRHLDPETEIKVSDVTGGMDLKISVMREIANYSRVYVINGFHPERIRAVLNDDDFVGTVVL